MNCRAVRGMHFTYSVRLKIYIEYGTWDIFDHTALTHEFVCFVFCIVSSSTLRSQSSHNHEHDGCRPSCRNQLFSETRSIWARCVSFGFRLSGDRRVWKISNFTLWTSDDHSRLWIQRGTCIQLCWLQPALKVRVKMFPIQLIRKFETNWWVLVVKYMVPKFADVLCLGATTAPHPMTLSLWVGQSQKTPVVPSFSKTLK